MPIKFSIIIPVKDDPRVFSLLAQLAQSQAAEEIEVVVSCNGSNEQFVEQVRGALASLPYSQALSSPIPGPSRAINFASKQINSEKFLILDSDCILADGFLEAFRLELDSAPILRGHIVYRGSSVFSCLTADWRQAFNVVIENEGRIYTPNLMIEKNLFWSLGGFSEVMRFSYDSNFSDLAMKQEHRAKIVHSAILYHDCHENIKTELKIWQSYGRGRHNRMSTHWQDTGIAPRLCKAVLGDVPFAEFMKSWRHFIYGLSYICVRFSGFINGMLIPKSKLG